jgi:ribosomal protein S18 acetylase RimI-like enzyme
VGKRLLEVAKSYASSRGYHEMTVKTEAFNGRAISFYEKMGFSEIHRLTEEIEGASINLVVLRLII